jgi:DNA-binding NarL/FixJ family response regulator
MTCMRSQLSERQWRIAKLVAEGERNSDIARDLGIAEGTVKHYVFDALEAVQVCNRTQLAVAIVRHSYECKSCKPV